jgi:8-oxo-dGTP pyrophosphatase MutT (NUDIX family)
MGFMRRTRKVVAYVVRDGRSLLVFTQPLSPEAGVQVPSGTIGDDETSERAVLREVAEETGITNVAEVRYLGSAEYNMAEYGRDELQERHFFALRPSAELEERWTGVEEHDGLASPEPFELFWIPLSEAGNVLEAGEGELLHKLQSG